MDAIEMLNLRFYDLCRRHGIIPPIGPVDLAAWGAEVER